MANNLLDLTRNLFNQGSQTVQRTVNPILQRIGANFSPQNVQQMGRNIQQGMPEVLSRASQFTPFTATRFMGQPVSQTVQQFRAPALRSASFGLINQKVPQPQGVGQNIANLAGNIVGSIPAFTGTTALTVGKMSNLARMKPIQQIRVGLLAENPIIAALTTSGGLKERTKAGLEQLKPSNLAFAAPLAIAGVRATQRKTIQNVIKNPDAAENALNIAVKQLTSRLRVNGKQGATAFIEENTAFDKYLRKAAPDLLNDAELNKLRTSDPKQYWNTMRTFLSERLSQANNPDIDMGLGIRKISKAEHIKNVGLTSKQTLQPLSPTSSRNISVENPVDSLVNAIIKSGTKERKFVTTVKGSIKTAPEVKSMVSGQYIPKANDSLSRSARQQIKANIDVAREKALSGMDDESVAIANELIGHYSAIKDYDTAAYIANTTAENLTAHGRAVQAASLYDKLTPEGVQRYASAQLQKLKMQLKPEDSKRLYDMAKTVQEMQAGTDKAMAQQQLMTEVQNLIPTSGVQKLLTLWKAGLLTGLKTTGRNVTGNTINQVSEVVKDMPATLTDMMASLFTGQRTKTFTTKGMVSGAKTGAQKGLQLLKTGFDERKQMGKLDINHVTWGNSPMGKFAKKYTETVFRFLGAQDQPFYYSALNRSLYDQAGAAAINAGKAGDKAFIQNLIKNPSNEMIKTSVLDAERAVFQNNTALSSAINSAKRAIKGKSVLGGALADFVAPFTGVPSSIIGQVVNYTPVGLAKTIIENIGKGKFNQRQFSEGVGRGLVGTAILAIGAKLMENKLMTLDYPKDPKEQAQWDLEGKQAFSVKGSDGKWHSIGSLGPQASVLLQGGYLAQGGAGQALLGGLKQQKEQTFLQGIKNISDAIDDPTRMAGTYGKSTAGSLIPTIVGDLAKGIDQSQRESNNPLQAMQAKIPILRQGLLPQRNVFGEAKPNENGFVGTMTDFTNSTTAKSSPVIDELRRLSDEGFSATPTKISADQTIQKMKVKLTPEQLDAFESKAGPIIQQRINQLISNPSYQSLSDEKKSKAIKDITDKVRTEVKNSLDLTSLAPSTFEKSSDAPKNALETIGLYGTAIFKDPGAVITALSNGQPVRKVRGDAVILERAQGLAAIDKGDKLTQVDHVIPLSLGGTNDQKNLQIISTQENQAKAVVETYLGDLLSKGKISKKEAQDRILNWRAEIVKMPSNYKNKANAILTKQVVAPEKVVTIKDSINAINKISGTYQLVSDTGLTDIKLQMPEFPPVTGYAELDKQNKSSYASKLTTLATNIKKLYLDGQITAEDANNALLSLKKAKVSSGGKAKKGKKITIKKPTYKKFKLATIKLIKIKKVAKPKFKKYTAKKITLPKSQAIKAQKIKVV